MTAAEQYPRLNIMVILYFDDIAKSELFNKFFCEQSTLGDSDHTPPDLTELQTDGLRQILITETEV